MFQRLILWYSHQEPAVKAALILGAVSMVTVCLGFIVKDYLIPIWLERRKNQVEKQNAFRNYRLPLINSATSFKQRLDELFRTRSHILWKDAPENDFYNYKIISTNYRLCSLLGWIYAFRLEESYLKVPSKKLHGAITTQLEAFRGSLADGQKVEMDVAKRMLSAFGIDSSDLQEGNLEKFSVEIDRLVQRAITPNKCHVVSECSVEEQQKFLEGLSELTSQLLTKKISVEDLRAANVIELSSIRLGLIYRDWQQAIGDLMVKRNEKGSGRGYDIISYLEFEDIVYGDESSKQKWLTRSMRLFQDLDVSKDNNSDNRVEQLRRVKDALEKLIDALTKCKV